MKTRDQQVFAAFLVLSRIVGHLTTCTGGWILDYIAWRTSPLLCVLAMSYSVSNGRLAPLIGYAADRLLVGDKETSFVFSFTMLLVFVAQPYVFRDTDVATTELWYSYSQHVWYTTPIFVIFSIFLHYPTATMAQMRLLFNQPPALSDALDWFWIVFAALATPYVLHTKIISNPVVEITLDAALRSLGRRIYDFRNRNGALPAPELDPAAEPYVHTRTVGQWEVRLLQLIPQGTSGKISGNLLHVDFAEHIPPYEAMSYVWGGQEPTETIFIDGKPFRTTRNVYNLLRDRSPIWTPRLIWIDSICINQADDKEKSEHVRIMGSIYRWAAHVTVYLGAQPGSQLAINVVLELSNYINTFSPTERQLYERYIKERRMPRWLAFGDLCANPYFARMWMVQEVACNSNLNVVYGREIIKWDTLLPVMLKAFTALDFSIMIEDTEVVGKQRSSLIASANAAMLHTIRDRWQNRKEGEKAGALSYLLPLCWDFKSTDPRDKVYGLLSIADDDEHPLVHPDYSKPVEQVYLDTATYLFSRPDAVSRVMCCAGVGWHRRFADLPSWAPDWSTVGRAIISTANSETSLSMDERKLFCASRQTFNRSQRVVDGTYLHLDVIMVGIVDGDRLGENYSWNAMNQDFDWSTEDRISMLRTWSQNCRDVASRSGPGEYLNGQPVKEALWRTLICDMPGVLTDEGRKHSTEWPAPEIMGTWYEYFLGHVLEEEGYRDGSVTDDAEDFRLMQLGSRWLTSAQARCSGRRFGLTKSGFFALLPGLTEPDDMVVVVPGAPVPYVIRAHAHDDEGQPVFQLVGECYVHGIMGGEAERLHAIEEIKLV